MNVARRIVRCGISTAAAACLAAAAQGAVDPAAAALPRAEFVAPAAGTYRLEKIQPAGDARLLDVSGRAQRLSSFTHGKITLLTFFYTYCVDPLGCPFVHVTLVNLRERVLADPRLAGAVRFVSVSLDPAHDTPKLLSQYAEGFSIDAPFEWRFLTASSVRQLLPVLDDFGQDVSVDTDGEGRATRTLHHMLKVFLIDSDGDVREIYSLAFLQPEVMFNDLLTLAMEGPLRESLQSGLRRSQVARIAPTAAERFDQQHAGAHAPRLNVDGR